MRIFFLLPFLLLSFTLQAQTNDIVLDYDPSLLTERCFCKPGVINKSSGKGVSFGYTQLSGYDLDFNSSNIAKVGSISKLKAKLKIPLINVEGMKLLLGYEYNSEKYKFDNIGDTYRNIFTSIDDTPLKINKFTVYLTKSFNEKYYAIFRLRTAYSGTYDKLVSFKERYATYSAIGAFGIKKREDLELGFGLSYSNSFRRTTLLPFLVYNQTFNDKWGIESLLPAQIYGRYNINPTSLLLFGFNFQSRNYSMDVDEQIGDPAQIYHFNHTGINASVAYERNLVPWVWFSIKGGYQYTFNAEFNDISSDFLLDANAGGAFFIRLSIFLSPPDKYIK